VNLSWMARIYRKLDVQGVYNLVRGKARDEHKLAFRNRYGLYEPSVKEFAMTNATADVQGYMYNALWEALDDFELAYLDNIMIYRDSEQEHVGHVKWIMQQLLEAGLYLKPEQCEIHTGSLRYFSLIISTKGIAMDEDKIETIRKSSREKNTENGPQISLFKVQQLLACRNYF
jgi:hypothetical protein